MGLPGHIGMFKPEMLPISRGFDSAFGYLCGSTGYWDHGNTIAFCPDPSDPSSNATITQFALVRRKGEWERDKLVEKGCIVFESKSCSWFA